MVASLVKIVKKHQPPPPPLPSPPTTISQGTRKRHTVPCPGPILQAELAPGSPHTSGFDQECGLLLLLQRIRRPGPGGWGYIIRRVEWSLRSRDSTKTPTTPPSTPTPTPPPSPPPNPLPEKAPGPFHKKPLAHSRKSPWPHADRQTDAQTAN